MGGRGGTFRCQGSNSDNPRKLADAPRSRRLTQCTQPLCAMYAYNNILICGIQRSSSPEKHEHSGGDDGVGTAGQLACPTAGLSLTGCLDDHRIWAGTISGLYEIFTWVETKAPCLQSIHPIGYTPSNDHLIKLHRIAHCRVLVSHWCRARAGSLFESWNRLHCLHVIEYILMRCVIFRLCFSSKSFIVSRIP